MDLDPKVMDKFVFAIVQKRSSGKLHKEMLDLVRLNMEVQTLIMFTCRRGSTMIMFTCRRGSNIDHVYVW